MAVANTALSILGWVSKVCPNILDLVPQLTSAAKHTSPVFAWFSSCTQLVPCSLTLTPSNLNLTLQASATQI